MQEIMEILKNNIKSLRVRAGLTQEQTAEKLKMSRANYILLENNPGKIKTNTYFELCKIFNCSINEFFLNINVT